MRPKEDSAGIVSARATGRGDPDRQSSRKDPKTKKPAGRALHDQLIRLGITREQDLALHLPLRYEDHTRLTALRALTPGITAQCEGVVANSSIQYRPRRQLVALLSDTADATSRDGQLVLRFFHF